VAATIKDVARRARVSIASVSRALNSSGSVTPEVRRRVRRAAHTLRYMPRAAARSLINRRTHTVGLLLPDTRGEYFSELIRGVDRAARARGRHLRCRARTATAPRPRAPAIDDPQSDTRTAETLPVELVVRVSDCGSSIAGARGLGAVAVRARHRR